MGIYSVVALILIGLIGAWKQAMVTLSMVVTAVVFCILIGIPLGIICARSDRSWKVVRPLLDIMQTTPLFVYLVPVVMLFGIGKVPGVIATFIFATPPLIRLTNLGIRQVSTEVVEAAVAFGSTPLQVLWEVQLPLALPTILAGLNHKTKLEVVGDVTKNLLQGYQIDKKTAVQYNITNIEQLKNPKIAKIFDSDGNGKANLFGCYPGTACELIIDHHLKAYGLQDTVEHVKGEPSVLIAETLARYKQRKPVLFFAYTPHWITLELKLGNDVVCLEVPFTSLPKEIGKFTKKDTSAEGKNLGFAVDRIRVVANKNFLERQPAARRFFELVQVPLEDVSAQQKLMKEGENRPKDIRLHAEKWVQKNQEQFNRWVEEASKAGQGTK